MLSRYTTAGPSYFGPLLHEWRASGSLSRFPLYDLTGSVRELVDASGAVTDTYTLDAFGLKLSSTGTTPNPYQYDGAWGYRAESTNLQQVGYRWYWPELGRFIQQDPIGDGMNWYMCVGNNPVVWVDPTGLGAWSYIRCYAERFLKTHYIDLSGTMIVPVIPKFPVVGGGLVWGVQFGYDPAAARRRWSPLHASTWRWAHFYAGPAAGTVGPGGAAMLGFGNPTHGWSGAFAGGSLAGLSTGLSQANPTSPWVELGVTSPGLAFQAYNLW